MNKYIVLSDIHGNLNALNAVLQNARGLYDYDGYIILGDNIDYGIHGDEVINTLSNLDKPIVVNIWGNHEKALFDMDLAKFSTDRGRDLLKYTDTHLSGDAKNYLLALDKESVYKDISNKHCYFVHGNINDIYWGKLNNDSFSDEKYHKYDYVFCGHTHIPMCYQYFSKIDNPKMRNRKRTIFINPGSVGQPRNHNPFAQYLFADLDNEVFRFESVKYNIDDEMREYPDCLHPFYKERLYKGV